MLRYISLLFLLELVYCSEQQKYFINHLIEKNGVIQRPITNELVIGNIYRYFENENMEKINVFIGTITPEGKNGNWIRWWKNGVKKSEGRYHNSVKEGLWSNWTQTGDKYSEVIYKNGQVIHLKNCLLENCE